MKKILAIILAALFVACAFAGCAKKDDEDKGAIIQAYLSGVPVSIDPSATQVSGEAVQVMGLLYEGLVSVNENGKLEKALAKDWEYEVDERDGYLKLQIELEDSRWSDGIIVDADDFVYAWSRILAPENANSNAALLYPVLNAKKVKEGLVSINDLGIYAIKDDVLEITFEKEFTDVEYFIERLASPALVPLREDIVTKTETWSVAGENSYITNGPFKVKAWSDSEFSVERNIYYRCVSDTNAKEDKIVKPYRFVTNYKEGKNPNAQYNTRYANEEVFYINLNGATAKTMNTVKGAKTNELLSTYGLMFNTNSELLKDERVRKALSLAIDREQISKLTATDTKAATGLIPDGIKESGAKKDFRKVGGDVISTKPNVEEAKKLLKEAGVKGGELVIECSNARDFEETAAYLIVTAWKELGFTVKVNTPKTNYLYNKANGLYPFDQNGADILMIDMQSMTTDAYSMLMNFSTKFGGNKIDLTTGMSQDDVVYAPNYAGFESAEYDAICESIINAASAKERAKAMHEAESFLMEKMPFAPLFFNCDTYVSQKLSGIEKDIFGGYDFAGVKQKGYHKYLPEED